VPTTQVALSFLRLVEDFPNEASLQILLVCFVVYQKLAVQLQSEENASIWDFLIVIPQSLSCFRWYVLRLLAFSYLVSQLLERRGLYAKLLQIPEVSVATICPTLYAEILWFSEI
jgi:hypothetical protein